MTSFDDVSLVKECFFPVKNYCSFINLFQTQAKKLKDNIYIHYELASAEGEIEVKTLTFGQVDLITTNLACELYSTLSKKSVISLLEDHSVYYPILLLSFYKLRIPVQMISSRNSPSSVCSLLKEVNSDCLFYGPSYKHMKDAILNDNITDVEFFTVPELNLEELSKKPLNPNWSQMLDQNFTEDDLSKTLTIVHSSGTTNAPKAVVWSNSFFMYFIQSFQHACYKRNQHQFLEDEKDILIGITPSFHMFGMYSSFNCILTGGSVYYCRDFPPTSKHVIKVMKRENITRLNAPPYFVHQIMHYMEETGDVQTFQKLKCMVTGGAATPKAIDEFYLKHKISVLNMYAMSDASHNRVDSNSYFYHDDAEKYTYLEHFDGDKYQMIIRNDSPFLATNAHNRENGDYATKDLFIKSKTVKDAYNYAGRADDVLVMLNGEKTNPLPMEDVIKTNPLVSQCTVFGEGKHCTAALIELNFETAKNYCLDEISERVHESVRKANKDAPGHSAILPEMVKIIPFSKRLITSDKGTVSRKRSIAYFQAEVDSMYNKFLTSTSRQKISHDINPDSIEAIVMKNVMRVLNSDSLLKNVSLFNQGLNSLLSIQLQNYLSEEISPVPQDFMYDYPTIDEMTDYFQMMTNKMAKSTITKTFNYQETTEILNKYLQSAAKDLVRASVTNYADPNDDKEHVVMLTGATGSLGAAILLKLLRNPKVKTVYALVRGNKSTDLMGRIAESFRKRGYSESELYEGNRVEALAMNVEQDYLGLSKELYNKLRSETTMILSCAWLLDFNQPVTHYDSECIKGLYNMIKFANREINPIHLHFISSVSATGAYDENVPEAVTPNNPEVALPMGYGQSKFIIEQLFHYLVESKNMPCYIHRVGQLCGDSATGSWNTTEMYPLTLMGGGSYMKKMPNLNITVNWIPVDIAGNTIVELMMNTSTSSPNSANETVFHIVNRNEVDWSSLLASMKKCGMEFDIIDPETWVQEVSKDQNNPCYKLLGFYKKLFVDGKGNSVRWLTNNTITLAPNMKQAPTVSDKFSVYLDHWKEVGFYYQ